jgi:hypothetical protein
MALDRLVSCIIATAAILWVSLAFLARPVIDKKGKEAWDALGIDK